MLSSSPRVDPRVRRTRKLLLDAFVALQHEKRFEEITIQDITDRATVNRATFYAHFVDKYALVEDLIREGFGGLLQARLRTPAPQMQDLLRQLFLAITDHWSATQSGCGQSYRLFGALVEAQVKAQVRESVREWLLTNRPRRPLDQEQIELAAAIASWGLYGAAMEWTARSDAITAESYAALALPLIASGIAG